ncbi:hypothetical protein D3C78_1814100 [compost metagenome]
MPADKIAKLADCGVATVYRIKRSLTANSATIQEATAQSGVSIATVNKACASKSSVNVRGE